MIRNVASYAITSVLSFTFLALLGLVMARSTTNDATEAADFDSPKAK